MLPRSKRLDKKNFDRVYNFGTNLPSEVGYFKVIRWQDNKRPTQVACVATRKQNKRATDRSRIRRRGYAAIKELADSLPSSGYGIIWFLPQEAIDADFSNLESAAQKMILSLDDV